MSDGKTILDVLLGEAVMQNFFQSIVTDTVRVNADFHYKAGLNPKIVRKVSKDCCDWCKSLEGTYNYEDVYETGNDVWRRHTGCHCTVIYDPGTGKVQNVWDKSWCELGREEKIAERKAVGIEEASADVVEARKTVGLDEDLADVVEDRKTIGLNEVSAETFEKRKSIGLEDKTAYSGAKVTKSGALDRYSKRASKHAKRYYEEIRHRNTDCKAIAKNTGYSEEEIYKIKEFVFLQKHELSNGKIDYFYPDYDMAESWQRLIEGDNIQKHDLTLIKHELKERELMGQGLSQAEAHSITEQEFNYAKECNEYHARVDKHKN